MDHRSAFSRADSYLNFAAGWKWTARIAAVGTAVSTAILFVLLALYIDLLIYRGRTPDFVQVRAGHRERIRGDIGSILPERRVELVNSLDAPQTVIADIAQGGDLLSNPAREWLWRAYVVDYFQKNVSEEAAETYRLAVKGQERGEAPPLGLLSLVLRQTGTTKNALAWIASVNPWTWRPSGATPQGYGTGPNIAYLAGMTLIAVFFAFARAGCLNLMNYAAATATLDAATRLRRAVYHHSSRLGTLALRDSEDNESVAIFTHHIEIVRDALFARLTTFFLAPLQLVLLLLLALIFDFWLAVTFFLLAAVVIILGGYIATRFRDRAKYEGRRADVQLSLLRESLVLMRMVKSNLMDAFNQSRVERQLAEYSKSSFRRFRNESLFAPLLIFLGTVCGALALFVAGYSVLIGNTGPGRLVALVAVLAAAFVQFIAILEQRRVVRRGRESARPIFEFLDRPAEIGQLVGAEFLDGIARAIEFRDVSLREAGSGRLLLDNLSLRIPAGQRVAIVGADEEEKHALVYLLLRFLDATTGEIRIDDKGLRWLNLDSLRAQIGVVLWNDLVFNDTVTNNIGCGHPNVTLPQVIESAKIAHAHTVVQRLPYGYETPIGDLGSSLRRTEKFRIALARAILKDPALYIIEEPTEPFDEENKGLVDDTLSRVLTGRTVIFLAHRISTIRSCDCVYLLHKGRVVAAGEHRELLARSELYKHLHYLEFNEFSGKT